MNIQIKYSKEASHWVNGLGRVACQTLFIS